MSNFEVHHNTHHFWWIRKVELFWWNWSKLQNISNFVSMVSCKFNLFSGQVLYAFGQVDCILTFLISKLSSQNLKSHHKLTTNSSSNLYHASLPTIFCQRFVETVFTFFHEKNSNLFYRFPSLFFFYCIHLMAVYVSEC